jgi:ABC-type polysaccharide/polyol phosphate transport system ATPase subunit
MKLSSGFSPRCQLGLRFGAGFTASTTISPGAIGVAGPNGSGKTTLFRTILGLLPILGFTLPQLSAIKLWLCQSAALDPHFPQT